MDFIQHTSNWYKGEMFEATLISIFGIVILIISVLFWIFGTTPNEQAIVIPLAIVGLLLSITSISMRYNNNQKLNHLLKNQPENISEFVKPEQQRVESFEAIYTYTKIGAGICFAIATLLFFVTENRHLQAIGIALIIIGVSGLTIDYFSKERAKVYSEHIKNAVK